MVAAVIFDMDGVLIDSEEIWSRVRAEVVARHGGHWTEQDQRNVMGDNSRQWSAYIKRTWNVPLSEDEIFHEVLAVMIATYERDGLSVLPGAREAVAALGARYPLAVASSSPRKLIAVALRVAGFDGAFQVTVSSDDVTHGKPAPDVYLLAAERLGMPAPRCAAVEDSSNGLRAAVAAGMATIAVPNRAFPPADDALHGVRTILTSLRDLTPNLIETL